jgi:hypothetical protein
VEALRRHADFQAQSTKVFPGTTTTNINNDPAAPDPSTTGDHRRIFANHGAPTGRRSADLAHDHGLWQSRLADLLVQRLWRAYLRTTSVADTVASRYGVSADDVVRDPAKYGLSATDITRYQNADQTKQGLDHDAGTDPLHPNLTYLFAYDPLAFGGKGRAAIAIGNPDTAKSTAVIVPGTSSVKGG